MTHPSTPHRVDELDALRGIAALAVVFFHFTLGRPDKDFIFNFGSTGVDLFFIISGFVIFLSIQKVNSGKEFVINRISRLYPTYWACVIFSFLINVIYALVYHKKIGIIQFLGNLTMFQYYMGIPNLDGPYWTMIIEMIFYIAMLLLFLFHLLKYINTIGVVTGIGITAFTLFASDRILHLVFLAVPFLSYMPLFFAGIIFYKIFTNQEKTIKNYAIIIGCLISQIFLYNHAGVVRAYLTQVEYAIVLVIYFSIFTLLVHRKLGFIVCKPMLFFGKISFALYLIHQKISVSILIPYLTNTLHINFWIAAFGIALPVVILLATFVTHVVEIPLGKKLRHGLFTYFTPRKLST